MKAIPNESDYMENAEGSFVPISKIQPIDLERDKFVKDIISQAQDLSQSIESFKNSSMNGLEEFLKHSAKKYKAKIGGKKGNFTLTSFDGKYKITHTIADRISFDERLQIAKQLVDECIQKWAKGSNENIKVLVKDAFYVDKQGKINKEKILGLRRLKISDSKWKQAMQAINDSIQVVGSKPYIRCYERTDAGDYRQIILDVANA